jgi:hypothetical protein
MDAIAPAMALFTVVDDRTAVNTHGAAVATDINYQLHSAAYIIKTTIDSFFLYWIAHSDHPLLIRENQQTKIRLQSNCFPLSPLRYVRGCPPPPQGERSLPLGYPGFSSIATYVKGFASGGIMLLRFLYLAPLRSAYRHP